MGSPLPVSPFQALPEFLRNVAANDNVAFRLRLVAAAEIAAASAEGVEAVAIATETVETVAAVVEVGAVTSYATLLAPIATVFLAGDSSPRMPKILPVIDQPPQGKGVSQWLDEMAEMAKLAALVASKKSEIHHLRQNGQENLARQVEQDLESLQIQVQTNIGINSVLGNRLEIMATASGGGGGGAAATGAAKESKADAPVASSALVVRDAVESGKLAIQWNPIVRMGEKNIHIKGDAMTMPQWIAAADRTRYLKAGAMLLVGNIPMGVFISQVVLVGQFPTVAPLLQAGVLMAPIVMTVGSLFGAVYLSQGGKLSRYFHELFPSSFGTNLRYAFARQDRPDSKDLAQVMSAWYRGLTRKLGGFEKLVIWDYNDVRDILSHSKKTVDGVEYDLLNLMDATPFFKPAESSYHRAFMLLMFEEYGRQWKPSDEHAIQRIQIDWDNGALYSGESIKLIRWLAKHDNESVVNWVYGHARTGEGQARRVFEMLLADRNPVALSILTVEVDTGGITIVEKPAK